jgi:hypothetical protein
MVFEPLVFYTIKTVWVHAGRWEHSLVFRLSLIVQLRYNIPGPNRIPPVRHTDELMLHLYKV